MRILDMYSGLRLAVLIAAILLLMTPRPSSGGPCDCSTCQTYTDQKSRCLCCVYHGVGGKRSVLDPSPYSGALLPLDTLPRSVRLVVMPGLTRGGANKLAKDGGEAVSRRWRLQTAGQAMTPQEVQNEAEFGLEPVLAVKTRGQREALGTSGAVDNFRRILLEADSV